MRFKNISEEDISFIKEVYSNKDVAWDERINILCKKFLVSERTIRRWLIKLGVSQKQPEDSKQLKYAKNKKVDKTKKKFIITWAQNNTPIHDQFFSNIEAYAKHIDADIHVIAGRYKNPTSVFSDKNKETWSKRVEPYLDAGRHNIHKYMSIMSDVKIQPTAVNPLSGLAGMSRENSCIFGHPKLQMESLPVLNGMHPKMIFTTGSCTLSNYTDSKAGKKGEFHHIYGFVLVEIKNKDKFFVRQVTANPKTGDFYDYDKFVSNEKVNDISQIEAIVCGDIHHRWLDEKAEKATFNIIDRLNPKNIILHDVFDGDSINHHEEKNPFSQYNKEKTNRNSLNKEINDMLSWLNNLKNYKVTIVRSNHDDFLDRWLINSDWKKNIKNALEYIEYSKILLEELAPDGIIPYLINQKFPDFNCLGLNSSFRIKNIELANHGHIGANGSRGGVNQFRKLNTKMIVAHSHGPQRKDGVTYVGTLTKLRMEYNKGASSWAHCNAIIHTDGRVQQIFIFDGEFTTL